MTVRWLQDAVEDLRYIAAWTEENSLGTSSDVAGRLRAAVQSLESFPARGRTGLLENTRELLVPGLPYLLVYSIQPDYVVLLRILHQHQQWPPA